jgi:hypothetical protein
MAVKAGSLVCWRTKYNSYYEGTGIIKLAMVGMALVIKVASSACLSQGRPTSG